MNITAGKINSAIKCIIYGVEGIGKSTFASHAPAPLFIDTEGSTKRLDVRRFDPPSSWEMLLTQVRYVVENPQICETLVIDTLDWAEKLALRHVLDKWQKKGIEEFGYGKGYVYLNEEFGRLPNLLDEVVGKGVNVLLTAHAQLRKFEQPDELGSYDRWEMKLLKQNSPMLKEWADMVLFANYHTFVVSSENGGKGKAQGGERVMYTAHHPCWDAKNRDGLPEKLRLDFGEIAHCFKTPSSPAAAAPPAEPEEEILFEVPKDDNADKAGSFDSEHFSALKQLEDLMKADNISARDIQEAVGSRGYFPKDMALVDYPTDFISGNLVGAWEQVKGLVVSLREQAF